MLSSIVVYFFNPNYGLKQTQKYIAYGVLFFYENWPRKYLLQQAAFR